MDNKTMVVNVTSKCNLDCHFCLGTEYMEKKDTNVDGLLEAITKSLSDNPDLEAVLWSGGEALLVPKKLWAAVAMVRELNPNCKHYLMTNGMSLKMDDLEGLQSFDRVYVSIDGFEVGERSVRKIVTKKAYEAFQVMAALKNVYLRSVITRDQLNGYRWHEDIIALMDAVYHINPVYHGLSFDIKMEKELSPDHILNFMDGFERLHDKRDAMEQESGITTELHLEKFFEDEKSCDCSQGWVVDPDGEGHGWSPIETKLDRGCNLLAKAIGQDAYVFIRNYVEGRRARLEGRSPVNLVARTEKPPLAAEVVPPETPLYKEIK